MVCAMWKYNNLLTNEYDKDDYLYQYQEEEKISPIEDLLKIFFVIIFIFPVWFLFSFIYNIYNLLFEKG